MSEKVKLTKEQAGAIESIRGDKNRGLTPGNIRAQLEKGWRTKPYSTLNELTFERFIVAVLGDYEVEETFEVGEWVISKKDKNGIAGQITEFEYDRHWEDDFAWYGINKMYRARLSNLRHATPEEIAAEKQRRWWVKHGREVWELRRNDLVSDKDGCSYTINLIKKDYVEFVEFGMRKKVKEIKESFKVICFAEDRKDINGGDNEWQIVITQRENYRQQKTGKHVI